MKNKALLIIVSLIFLILIIGIGIFLKKEVYDTEIAKARDSTSFFVLNEIKSTFKGQINKNFYDLSSFNNLYNTTLKLSDNCYYLFSINNGEGFIFALKLKYIDNINRYGEYYIYTNPEGYNISNEEMDKIKNIIAKNCK